MNAITLQFADGMVNDPAAFVAADAATQARIFGLWSAHDGRLAAAFADKVSEFIRDAQVGYAFLTPQLHRIETQVYMRKYPSFDLTGIVFVNEDGDMWDVGTVFYSMDGAGKAEFLSGKGFDMPLADNQLNQFSQGYQLAGVGYEWTTQEMQRAAKLGRSLSSDKAKRASQVAAAFKRSVAMTGKTPGAATSEKNWTGLINYGGVPTANVAATGTGSTTPWANKTPDQISDDIWAAVNAIETQTGETHVATTVLLPTAKLRYVEQKRMSDTGSTILSYVRGARDGGDNITFKPVRELAGAGAGGTDRMVALDAEREVAQFHLPGDHEFLPAFQKSSMTYEVGGIMNVGGTEIRLPKAITYRDGI